MAASSLSIDNTTYFMNHSPLHIARTTFAGTILVSCLMAGCGTKSNQPIELSPEQLRLEAINHLDSTSLPAVLSPDSIEGFEQLSDLSAQAWMLVDDSTGIIISQKNAYQHRTIASLTKMMTCLLSLEKGNPTDTVQITEEVFIAKDSRVRLGEAYELRHLIYEMMLISDNDAAYALAAHIGGDTLHFYDQMNQKAAYLGMDSTHFANPNGVPNINNYSSPNDLIRLARYAMRDSAFATIVGTTEYKVPFIDGRHMNCRNTNALLYTYQGCIGIKTGFTRQAGNCLMSAATRDGHTLYLALLGSHSMSSRFTESAILLDYGFRVMQAYDKTFATDKSRGFLN